MEVEANPADRRLMRRCSAAGSVLGEDTTVAGICDDVAAPGAAGPGAGCTHDRSGAGSIPNDVDVAVFDVLRRVAARFRQCIRPDQRIVMEIC